MALAFFWNLQHSWPFSVLKYDDLRVSDKLVRKLSVPEHTKKFIFAVQEPETQSVIYILAAQNLSERSALDAESLIREVRPDAVVAQVGHLPLTEIQLEESELRDGVHDPVPTSSFEVLKRCFIDKINKEKYENVAGNVVLREIFGIGFHGHLIAAKKAAEEFGSSFLVLESPFMKFCGEDDSLGKLDTGNKFQGLVSSLVPQRAGSVVFSNSQRFCLTGDVQKQMVKSLSPYMDLSILRFHHLSSVSEVGSDAIQPICSFEAPPFAQSIYPLLLDLHNIFAGLPSIGRALAHAQKMLLDVNRGATVDTSIISEVYDFRIAVEGLRIALNNAGRLPINKIGNPKSVKVEFSELPIEDKSHVLFAQTLRSQTKKFKTIVAVVDASSLADLRKHWNTPVPPDVKELVEQIVMNCEDDDEHSNHTNKKRLLTGKPVVAVGAGATAVLGASSLSKVVPASTVMKVVTFKIPAYLKFFLSQTQKAVALPLSKILASSKAVAPGVASHGAKTSILKSTASAEKIRVLSHSVIASVEKTSFSAMRTAFYEIMRKRQVRPIGFLPWATFGCSVATCTGLLAFGDGIECAVESLPAAPSIASLGRGIQSLLQASKSVTQTDGTRIQKSMEALT
ncbi:hypothetical protein I3843_02G044500 [Carya illinoinensis]|uniref:Uncharacterized protein n=1 Tax=Carya illinoinensis TaxID=32201 RepID=A0A922JZB6_CARIL|nr:hypothetical protein I3760_02G056100 [Carya illinoinensis]KAG6725946.1 hypothetical protein I3842_02G055800 [Carya illinoinensis]KAG7990846.1 hypothetical protein I3843_02G044500 [Carya illinoinensis]